ncbi:MAG: hypothetical protein KJZ85_08375 [Rhodobacteraceae bacterium]|nr:hypothetical protein [Paracoccaceae bacterium]
MGSLLLASALIGCVLITAGVLVTQARQSALQEARSAAGNLASLLHEQTLSAFRSTDLALQVVRERLEDEGIAENDPRFRSYLQMLQDELDHVRALFVIGSDGFIVHDTDYPDTPRVSLADRPYFRSSLQLSPASVFIGSPLLSRSVDRWFVPVARSFNHPVNGAGIVVAAVEPLFFERLYSQLQLGEHDSIALFHTDSTLIASAPAQPDLYGQRLGALRLFTEELPASPSGAYRVQGALSGRSSLIGYARLTDFPLIVTVAIDEATALAAWRRQAALVALICLSIIAVGFLLYLSVAKRRLERKMALQKSMMQEKLEAVGYMTSSVAHDFRNLLAAAHAGVRLLRRRGPSEQLLAALEDTLSRGNQLTSDLLHFVKDQESEKVVFNPNSRIQQLAALLEQTTHAGVAVEYDLAPDVRDIEASPAAFDSSLINLAVNSCHAMPDGGRLKISTFNVSLQSNAGAELRPGDYVSIRVEDTGHGIPREKLDGIFEPFVTSKGSGGTGLGLFQVRRFVCDLGGDARIESEEGNGTAVELLLPAVKQVQSNPEATPRPHAEPRFCEP